MGDDMTQRRKVSSTGLLVVLCLCAFTAPVRAGSQDTIEQVFAAKPGGRLTVDTDIGSITVRTGRPDEVRITITRLFPTSDRDEIEDILDDLDIGMDANDNGVTIDTRYRQHGTRSFFSFRTRHDRLRLRYEIVVPETYDVELATSDDDIAVAGLAGSVRSTTSDGDIAISAIDGPVAAKTSDGDIRVDTVAGDVDVQTSDGDIEVITAGAEVSARTSDGDITVRDAGGPVWLKTSDGDIYAERIAGAMDCTGSDGDITVTLIGQPTDDCQLRTSDGDISITLDKDSAFSVEAHTSDGGIDYDDITVRLGKIDRHNLVADLNGGGPELNMRTSDGNIRLRVE